MDQSLFDTRLSILVLYLKVGSLGPVVIILLIFGGAPVPPFTAAVRPTGRKGVNLSTFSPELSIFWVLIVAILIVMW